MQSHSIFAQNCNSASSSKAPIVPKLILITDDNASNRAMLLHQLKILGFDPTMIHQAQNGLDAVERAKQNNYDLIIMDYQMPIMNGKEATDQIAKDQSQKAKKSFIISWSTEEEWKKTPFPNAHACMQKPSTRAELEKILTQNNLLQFLPSNVTLNTSAYQSPVIECR